MTEKYFMHRIQKEGGTFTKGIEVHDTLDSAVLSFWGRLKLGYGKNQAITFMACKITDGKGNTVAPKENASAPYDLVWKAESEIENTFFLHHIQLNGNTFTKDIDVYESFDAACADFAAQMEYGYQNPKFPNVTFVSCQITDILSGGMELMDAQWIKPDDALQE